MSTLELDPHKYPYVMASVFPIAAGTQSYDWGRVGLDSKAARYALHSIPEFKLEESKPYAEVRCIVSGTHSYV
jgi:Phosphomannose isomerase type I, catalytic domain